MSDHEILVQHMVDIEKATAEFREESERKHATSSHMNSSSKRFATLSIVQRRLSIYNWNPGPRRGKEDAFEQQIAGRWHNITLQEAADYVDHELLTNRFHVTHYAGCAVLINKDTFYPNVDVKSIYLHDTRRDLPDQVMEGEQGWVMQGVLSRAIFRRPPVSGQKYFTVLSLHISNIYAKKKGIAKKLILTLRAIKISQEVVLVAGDFNGTAWRRRSRDNLSTIDEAFADCALPTPPGPKPLWGLGSIPNNWADVCGFLKPPDSQRFWKANKHGAFSIPRKTLGLRPNDQSCHHETWLHLHFVDRSNTWSKQEVYEQRISLKKTTRGMLIRESQRTHQRNHERPLALFVNVWLRTPGLFFSLCKSWPSQQGWILACSLLVFPLWRVVLPSFGSHHTACCTVRKCPMWKTKERPVPIPLYQYQRWHSSSSSSSTSWW